MQLDEGEKKEKGALSNALKSSCIKKEVNAKQVSFMLLLDEQAAVYILSWLCSQSDLVC